MKQIIPGLYQISLGPVNAFLIQGDETILVDTGLPGMTKKLIDKISESGVDPKSIQKIVLTHHHPDHSGNAAELAEMFKAPVYAHELDAGLLEQGIAKRTQTVTPGLLNWLLYNLFIKRAPKTVVPVKIAKKLSEGDFIDITNNIRVVHTPGHSLGHISLLMQKENLLIAADICGNMGKPGFSPVYEDLAIGKQSILKAARLKADKAVFGHGELLDQNTSAKLESLAAK